ncbi:hypothetical protein L21TH_1304 [Caldisalinibacter kiritimatiensis]|uniref:Uncharacterized protein n=1 Tax=Caldisalinibacter kiritimatiensis TaxID=1304284 RepID=R1AU59_9FIRM|nr:hypothetical protein [Caldisalinibacter kiritimatiensis]EOD00703.1 hypothetical protein L21TH_1304 [Caldisalinibacter kiritimatiensis]
MEKVLRPPSSPVVSKSFVVGDRFHALVLPSNMRPISMLANTLAIKVPYGNESPKDLRAQLPIKYLIEAPIKPPIPT